MVLKEIGVFPILLFTLAMDLSNRQEGYESGKPPFHREEILRLFFFFFFCKRVEIRLMQLEAILINKMIMYHCKVGMCFMG